MLHTYCALSTHICLSEGVLWTSYGAWLTDLVKKRCLMAHILGLWGHNWPKIDQLQAVGSSQDHFQVVLLCTGVEYMLICDRRV